MTAQVVSISSETIPEFIRRQDVACTTAVAARFGLEGRAAYRELLRLEVRGEVKRIGRRSYDWGAEIDWRAA